MTVLQEVAMCNYATGKQFNCFTWWQGTNITQVKFTKNTFAFLKCENSTLVWSTLNSMLNKTKPPTLEWWKGLFYELMSFQVSYKIQHNFLKALQLLPWSWKFEQSWRMTVETYFFIKKKKVLIPQWVNLYKQWQCISSYFILNFNT